jgi:hypothetical protein
VSAQLLQAYYPQIASVAVLLGPNWWLTCFRENQLVDDDVAHINLIPRQLLQQQQQQQQQQQ